MLHAVKKSTEKGKSILFIHGQIAELCKQKKVFQYTHNISTRRGGVEFGTGEDKPASGAGEDLNL